VTNQQPPRRTTRKTSVEPPPEFVIPIGLSLTEKHESPLQWEFSLEGSDTIEKCPRCPNVNLGEGFKHMGHRGTRFKDRPIGQKPVYLNISRHRFSCMSCHHVFSPRVRQLERDRRGMTLRLVEFLKQHVLESNFPQLAAQTQVSRTTLFRLADERIHELETRRKIPTPRFLGVFSCQTVRRRFCIITNVEEGTFIDLLPDDKVLTVEQWLERNISVTTSVRVVQIDLCEAHRVVLKRGLPNLALVVSWRCLDEIMERVLVRASSRLGMLGSTVRAKLKKQKSILLKEYESLTSKEIETLESILERHPYLRPYHELKQRLSIIRSAPSITDARSCYREWRNLIPRRHLIHFEPVLNALAEWEDELFGSLGMPQEMLNHVEMLREVVRELNKSGAGFSYTQLRGRLLFSKKIQQKIPRLKSTLSEIRDRQRYGSDLTS
jgi:transposase